MKKNLIAYSLGGTLYSPATNQDILLIANGYKFKGLKSFVICTEDSILEEELNIAYLNIENMLKKYKPEEKLKVFIRVRNVSEFKNVLNLKGVEKIFGFVLPKFDTTNMVEYMNIFNENIEDNNNLKHTFIMPILETEEIYEKSKLKEISNFLHNDYKEKILTIRIGGNDLLKHFHIRRNLNGTAYDTLVLSTIITNILIEFKLKGFIVSAPVWESFSIQKSILNNFKKEIKMDLENGLFGKTIIHPRQIEIINEEYKVNEKDYKAATMILDDNYPAVFKYDDKMCEKTVHTSWAETIIERSKIYGVKN